MQTDRMIARSSMTGHEVRRRMELKFGRTLPRELLDEIQHQIELAYLGGARDVFTDIAALAPPKSNVA